MNSKNKSLVSSVFIAILLAVFIHVAPCAAQLTSGDLTLNGAIPTISIIPSGDDDDEWQIFTLGRSLEFQGVNPSDPFLNLEPKFQIHNDANKNALVLYSKGALFNFRFPSNSSPANVDALEEARLNEVEIFGLEDSDFFAGIAVTPTLREGSVRLAVNTDVNAWGIDARGRSTNGDFSGQDVYDAVIRSSLDARTNTIAMDDKGFVGIGGRAFEELEAELHIQGGGDCIIKLEPDGLFEWELRSLNNGLFALSDTDRATGVRNSPFVVAGSAPSTSIWVEASGDVGMGTSVPDSALHIFRGDSQFRPQTPAIIKVEDAHSAVANRDLMELVNNGGVRFVMDNLDAGERWEFSNNSIGDFNVNRTGTGGPEMRVTRAGRMTSGPAGFAALDSRPNGNLFIAGTLFESSDRDKKENFEVVNCDAILKQVVELPITTWNYKSDEQEIRHMGPVAQDFRKAFKLGDSDKTIATTDKVGVSIAAIKALNSKLQKNDEELRSKIQEKDSQIETLENELNEMAERMEKFEAMLEASLK